ncbi:MAG: hypothetical protein J7J25_04565 [Candidatus Omnitrophica bacterium]|nr:hypothetical protein [Candidatus Omnitrophota bacterium]
MRISFILLLFLGELVVSTSVAFARYFYAGDRSFSFQLPASWQEIPKEELDKRQKAIKNMWKLNPQAAKINYEYAFQPATQTGYFNQSYLLIRVVRRPLTIREAKSALDFFSQKITRVRGSDLSNLSLYLNDIKDKLPLDQLIFFQREKMFLFTFLVRLFTHKEYKGATAIFLGRDRYIILYFYFSPQDEAKAIRGFKTILSTFHVKYPYVRPKENKVRILILLGMIVFLLLLFYRVFHSLQT